MHCDTETSITQVDELVSMRLARTLAYNGCRLVHLHRPLPITKAQAQYFMTALMWRFTLVAIVTQTNVKEQGVRT